MPIDWNEVHASGKQYTAMSDAVLDAALAAAGNPKTILEIACGSGYLLAKLAQRGLAVTGTDISPIALAKAQEALTAANLSVTLIKADVNTPGFAQKLAGPYDALLMRLALAFIGDCDAFLAEAKTLLNPSGTFIMSTPVLLEGVTYNPHQTNISIPKQELETLLARHFKEVTLTVPDEAARPEWPLSTYVCR